MAAKELSELEKTLRFEPDAEEFGKRLAAASHDEAFDALHALVTASDPDKTGNLVPDLARRAGQLFDHVAIADREAAEFELIAAAGRARPDIFRELFDRVKDEAIREDALAEAAAADVVNKDHAVSNLAQMLGNTDDLNREVAFKAMVSAITENKPDQLELLATQYPDILNRTEREENVLLMAVLNTAQVRERRQEGFLRRDPEDDKMSIEEGCDFIRLLLQAGAKPTHNGREGFVYGMEKKHFPEMAINDAARALMEYRQEKGLPRERVRYEDDHPYLSQSTDAGGRKKDRRQTAVLPDQGTQTQTPVTDPSPTHWSEGRRGNTRGGKPHDAGDGGRQM